MRRLIRFFVAPFYWALMNRLRNHKVESYSVAFKTRIGKKVVIRAGSEIGPNVSIGDYSYISGPRAYVEAAEIGKFCSIARQTTIGVSSHDHRLVSTHPFIRDPGYGISKIVKSEKQKAPPVIGHDVWIGMNSVVHRGVRIGIGAVVASDAVVTRDVEPYSIVAGNPARHLKYRFEPDVINALIESRWWCWSDERLAAAVEDFSDPLMFLSRHCGYADKKAANNGIV